MRTLSFLIGICLVGVLAGCSWDDRLPSKGRYRVDVEEISRDGKLVILRLTLTFAGGRQVSLFEEQDKISAKIRAPSQGAPVKCEVLIVADLIDVGDKRMVKWHHQIRGAGVIVGGPATYSVDSGKSLDDLLDVRIKPGEYDCDSEVVIALFQGRALRINMQPDD